MFASTTSLSLLVFSIKRTTNEVCAVAHKENIWATACDFQQCGILTSVDSDEPVQPHFKLRNSKWCSFSSLTLIEYSCGEQRLWSDCAYAQACLSLCWSHIPQCWKSHAHLYILGSEYLSKFDKEIIKDILTIREMKIFKVCSFDTND